MDTLSKLSIRDLALEGKTLFLRVDFNVPLTGSRVVDDTRIRAVLPTLELAVQSRARVVLASHLGRPDGRPRVEFSLRPIAHYLSQLVGRDVGFAEDCVGPTVASEAEGLRLGGLLLLENLRFHQGETRNDPEFTRQLCSWAQEYVNDAFGAAHRAHSSTVGVPQALGKGAAGLLMDKELRHLSQVLFEPRHPVVAILGGAKISDKIEVIENFLRFTDSILIGGGMAFTFLKAQGVSVGKSLVEEDGLELASQLIRDAESAGVSLRLPVDHVVAPEREAGIPCQLKREISGDEMALDVGPGTLEEFRKEISRAKTIIWNGPLGVFEIDEFATGTLEVARAVAQSRAFSVVGGGDSVAAVRKAGVADQITHLSTGGGASLEFLAGKKLPGVDILTESGGEES